MLKSYNRTNKNKVREIMFGDLPPAGTVLTLPGPEALCVREMASQGVINHTTEQVWVERNRRVINQLVGHAAVLNMRPTIIPGDIERFVPDRKFDLINLDLEQSITVKLGRWMERDLARCLTLGASVIVTLTDVARNGDQRDFFDWSMKKLMVEGDIAAYRAQTRWQPGGNDATARSVILTLMALHQFEFDMGPVQHYRDCRWAMHCFRLDNCRPRKASIPSFSDFISKYQQKKSARVITSRNKATRTKLVDSPLISTTTLKADTMKNINRPKNPNMVLAGFKAAETRRRRKEAALLSTQPLAAQTPARSTVLDDLLANARIVYECEAVIAATTRRMNDALAATETLRAQLVAGERQIG